MNTTELIYKKAKTKEELFSVTELEAPQSSSSYTGKALTIEEMDAI